MGKGFKILVAAWAGAWLGCVRVFQGLAEAWAAWTIASRIGMTPAGRWIPSVREYVPRVGLGQVGPAGEATQGHSEPIQGH
ncbi:hypothetical protein F4775DRAFT_555072 [Biscogniauxia sp. FL1348]|nr:hypothetical protein F4775DRAFT_555072 [Biscogniauxia sp. FL1348]